MKISSLIEGHVYLYEDYYWGVYLGPIKVEQPRGWGKNPSTTTKARMLRIGVADWDAAGEPLPDGEYRVYIGPESFFVPAAAINSEYAESRDAAIERIHADHAAERALAEVFEAGRVASADLAARIDAALKGAGISGYAIASVKDDGSPHLRIEIDDCEPFVALVERGATG